MNRAIWLRILTVAVIAPYLFKLSGKETGYFAVGLKLTAGALVAMNIAPLMDDAKVLQAQAQGILKQVAAAQATLNKTQRVPTTVDAEDISEAEFVDAQA